MQEEGHEKTYNKNITTRYALADACRRTPDEIQQREDHTIPRGRENYDHRRGGGEQLERHKGSPIGTSKERNIKLRSLEHNTFLPHAKNIFYTFQNLLPQLLRTKEEMHPANGETSTTATTETPHAAMSWTACFDDGCLVHLSDKQGAYFPRQTTRRQPNRKGKKLRWGEPVEEPKIHHEVGTFVVQLQEEMLRMADEIGRLKQENREMKKRVVSRI